MSFSAIGQPSGLKRTSWQIVMIEIMILMGLLKITLGMKGISRLRIEPVRGRAEQPCRADESRLIRG
jgi:hypothetical protein